MTMNIWKEKVLPKIKKVFEKSPGKKALAAEAVKAFDEVKDQHATEFEEKKGDLQSKVVEIYEASPPEVKALVKDPKPTGLKKNSAAVQKFLDELVKIDFPGSKAVAEAATKLGPAYVPGPITFLFEKVATLLPEEVKEEAPPVTEEAATTTTEEPAAAPAESSATTATEEVKEKEIVVEAAEKKEEEAAAPAAEAPPAEKPAEAEALAATEEVKKEEPAAATAEPPKAT
ncbi:OLC1v1025555C1 [Oldenlandia corymbosa var. corymbosa]|uniref:OLC1v1025555C1 n=1 Tax=Oldenlandia corymbosa var. corymbosa TaxID=529605 RepID=A0AAV1C6U4_OLDCO|nr:OLC1v1025555C1 [Oldenlandia corymbosa var. corymbosa]